MGVRRFLSLLPVCLLALTCSGTAQAAGGYVSPFSTTDYTVGRTDMGVDVCLSAGDPIDAVGDGVVVGIVSDWFDKQPYVWYELTSGADAGDYVYVAEQIDQLPRVGQKVSAGKPIARYAKRGTCIEMGWAAQNGETLAQATTGYKEGEVTTAGISFARFLISVGVKGTFELTPPPTQSANKKKPKKSTQSSSKKSSSSSSKKSSSSSSKKSSSTTKATSAKKRKSSTSHTSRGRSVSAPSGGGGLANSGAGSSSQPASGGAAA